MVQVAKKTLEKNRAVFNEKREAYLTLLMKVTTITPGEPEHAIAVDKAERAQTEMMRWAKKAQVDRNGVPLERG